MSFFSKPKYSIVSVKKKDFPESLWIKCPISGEFIYKKDLEANANVAPQSGYHFPLDARKRIELLLDQQSFSEMDSQLSSADPLNFVAKVSYQDKIKENQKKTGLKDAIITGTGNIETIPIAFGVMDFRFLGASMGAVVGEKITRLTEVALEKNIDLIIVSASGGARMYEGILSLMQMAKTSAAIGKLQKQGGFFISVMTDPTMAGVTASFASLGDLILAEPGARIGFAGQRVIRDAAQQNLPEGFQTAEFLLKKGLIDQIVPRTALRQRLAYFLKICKTRKTQHATSNSTNNRNL